MHPFDILELNNGAKFIFTPCPGTKDTSISSAFDTLTKARADAVITLLLNDELEALSVPTLSSEAAQKSFNWFQLPIEDDCAPEQPYEEAWATSKNELLALVKGKKNHRDSLSWRFWAYWINGCNFIAGKRRKLE